MNFNLQYQKCYFNLYIMWEQLFFFFFWVVFISNGKKESIMRESIILDGAMEEGQTKCLIDG